MQGLGSVLMVVLSVSIGHGTCADIITPPSESASTHCSLGDKVQTVLNESDRVEQPGTYLLTQPVACSGHLTSLYMCGFYNDNVTSHFITFGVFRRMGLNNDTYGLTKKEKKTFTVDLNSSKAEYCHNWTIGKRKFIVQADDRLAMIVSSCRDGSCSLVPILNDSEHHVFYIPSQVQVQVFAAKDLENRSYYVEQRINVQANITYDPHCCTDNSPQSTPTSASTCCVEEEIELQPAENDQQPVIVKFRSAIIAGGVVGPLAVIGILVWCLVCCICVCRIQRQRRQAVRRQREPPPPPPEPPPEPPVVQDHGSGEGGLAVSSSNSVNYRTFDSARSLSPYTEPRDTITPTSQAEFSMQVDVVVHPSTGGTHISTEQLDSPAEGEMPVPALYSSSTVTPMASPTSEVDGAQHRLSSSSPTAPIATPELKAMVAPVIQGPYSSSYPQEKTSLMSENCYSTPRLSTPIHSKHKRDLIRRKRQTGAKPKRKGALPTGLPSAGPADSDDSEDPYWKPASREEELVKQIERLHIAVMTREDLMISDQIGRGQFGTVTKGVWHSPSGDVEVAVKSLQAALTEEERVKFLQEAAIMGQFRHPNIILIHGVVIHEHMLSIVTEMAHNGDLSHYLRRLRPRSGSAASLELPSILLSFCRQVAAGMSYLSHKGFIHRDLAARNILVSQSEECKIGDFGLARDLQKEEFYSSHGTRIPVKWTAPEVFETRMYSSASDVWSYGVLLYEIWSLGKRPYQMLENADTLLQVRRGYRLRPPPGCPRTIYELMVASWNSTVGSRPRFADLLGKLQTPDFRLLRWSQADLDASSEAARTLGHKNIDAAKDMFKELQEMYLD